MKEYIGIDIGGTKCAVVLGNERGEIVRKLRFPTQGRDETLKRRRNWGELRRAA